MPRKKPEFFGEIVLSLRLGQEMYKMILRQLLVPRRKEVLKKKKKKPSKNIRHDYG